MNTRFLMFCLQVVAAGLIGAAVIAVCTFVLFSLGDTIFVTGGGLR
jgi:hypothetical protein